MGEVKCVYWSMASPRRLSHVKNQREMFLCVKCYEEGSLHGLCIFARSFCHYCKLFRVRAEKQGQNASNLSPLRIQWRSTKLLPCIEWSWAEQAWHRWIFLPPQLHQSLYSKPVEKWIIRFLHGIQRLLQRFVGFVAEILDATGLASEKCRTCHNGFEWASGENILHLIFGLVQMCASLLHANEV